jgi:hypothetical protein
VSTQSGLRTLISYRNLAASTWKTRG